MANYVLGATPVCATFTWCFQFALRWSDERRYTNPPLEPLHSSSVLGVVATTHRLLFSRSPVRATVTCWSEREKLRVTQHVSEDASVSPAQARVVVCQSGTLRAPETRERTLRASSFGLCQDSFSDCFLNATFNIAGF